MIVVIGWAHLWDDGTEVGAGGLAVDVSLAAAASGSHVELITRIGEDPDGDRLLLELAQGGVGHVAVLRDPAFATERVRRDPDTTPDGVAPTSERSRDRSAASAPAPALDAGDVELALRYLGDIRVIVLVDPDREAIAAEAVAAAAYSSAHLVIVVAAGDDPSTQLLPEDALVIGLDDRAADAGGTAAMIGRYAAAVDRGDAPSVAFDAAANGTASPPGSA